MSAQNKADARLTIGGEPRADLLPPEIKQASRGRLARRGMAAIVVLLVVLVGAGYGLASFVAAQSQARLDAANQRTTSLLAEQGKYSEVRRVTTMLTVAEVARQRGSSTEIDWKSYLAKIQAILPAGTVITTFTVDSGSPLAHFQPPSVPLQQARVASLTFEASSSSLPDVKAWLEALKGVTGYADAWPGTVTRSDSGYRTNITMHISQDALANRYVDATAAAETAGSTEGSADAEGDE